MNGTLALVANPWSLSRACHPYILFMVSSHPESPSSYQSPCECSEWAPVHWPFRRAPGILADSLLFPADRVPAEFCWQSYAGSSSRPWCSGLGYWWGVEAPLSSRGLLQLRSPSSFSAIISACRYESSTCLCPSYQALYSFFIRSVGIILLLSFSLFGHSGWLVFILTINPVWHQKKVYVAFI